MRRKKRREVPARFSRLEKRLTAAVPEPTTLLLALLALATVPLRVRCG
jgi:hypothetical protein